MATDKRRMLQFDVSAIRSGNYRAVLAFALDAMIVLVPIGMIVAVILLQ